MKEERKIAIDGQMHTVVISDEQEALLTAAAVGRAVVGVWDRTRTDQELSPANYLVEQAEDADEVFLERVVRRHLGLPWIIGETERLIIREFSMKDLPQVPREPSDREADRVFYTPELLEAYIRNRYGFYEYGIWALVDKGTGALVGKAGVSGHEMTEYEGISYLELGYHIFEPYRRRGYAAEACREIRQYVKKTLDCALYAKIDPSNEASIQFAKRCGFPYQVKI